jgi:hypothetical protein
MSNSSKKISLHFEFKGHYLTLEINSEFRNKLNKDLIHNKNNKITLSENLFSDEKIVPNVYRYIFEKNKSSWILVKDEKNNEDIKYNNRSKFNDRDIKKDDNIASIVLLLESPHKDEYSEDFKPIGPAQGLTGDKIDSMLLKIMNLNFDEFKLDEKKYRIILMNPVPYQTSLNYLFKNKSEKINKSVRNKVWKKLWENIELQDEFKNQISDLKPELIFNACTSELKPNISKFLKTIESLNKTIIFEINHPSSWNIPEIKKLSCLNN